MRGGAAQVELLHTGRLERNDVRAADPRLQVTPPMPGYAARTRAMTATPPPLPTGHYESPGHPVKCLPTGLQSDTARYTQVIRLFLKVWGCGETVADKWYAAGCRWGARPCPLLRLLQCSLPES